MGSPVPIYPEAGAAGRDLPNTRPNFDIPAAAPSFLSAGNAMSAYTLRPLSLGEVLDVSFGLYRSRFSTLVTVAVVTQSLPLVLGLYLDLSGGAFQNLGLAFLYLVLALVLGTIGTAASTMIVSGAYLGHETGAREALIRALSFIGTLIAISLAVGIVVWLGLILLIVPGLIALAGYAVSTPVAILEAPKTQSTAMARSWDLTRGFRGKVLGTIFVGFMLIYLPAMALGGLAGANSLTVRIVTILLQVLAYPYMYVLTTVLYYDLRVRKEGFDLEVLSQALQPAA
jgi:hypothetical protein